jgi:hypothetical protein
MDLCGIWQEPLIKGYYIGTGIHYQQIVSLTGFVPAPDNMANITWRFFIPAALWIVFFVKIGTIEKSIRLRVREYQLKS